MASGKKASIIVHSGDLDKVMSAFIVGNGFLSVGMPVTLFFTFWGLDALKKGGLDSAKLPGVMSLGTGMMKGRIKDAKVPTLTELLQMSKEMDNLKIYACSTTMELMKVKEEDLIPEVDDIVGAAAFLDIALDADIHLFI